MMSINKRELRKRKSNTKRKRILFTLGIILLVITIGSTGFYIYKKIYIQTNAYSVRNNLSESPDEIRNEKISYIESILSDKHVAFSKISLTTDGYIVWFSDGSEAVLSPDKNLTWQISSLQYIISRLTMDGRGFKKIDLRFDKPVVVF